ncbi:MAG: substrate-binding domain-containing protein [Thermoleophilia bacterium]|nr:substrate-binding domain-containing protein [Thermoleophilia bacterium]
MKKRVLSRGSAAAVPILVLLSILASGCGDGQAGGNSTSDIIVASTTSTKDSGLFDVLLPAFEQAYPDYRVKVNAVGTGEALKLGEKCDADVVLVHSPEAEEKFVTDEFGTERREIMYNEFVIAGAGADPAGADTAPDASTAFSRIAQTRSGFISRGDESGTHKAEKKLWVKGGVLTPSGVWYRSTGQGMGETLRIADETRSYVLVDLGTWLSMKDSLSGGVIVLLEGDPDLFNQYGVIPVNPERCPAVNARGAAAFADWLASPEGQNIIGEYGQEQYGRALFTPNAAQ